MMLALECQEDMVDMNLHQGYNGTMSCHHLDHHPGACLYSSCPYCCQTKGSYQFCLNRTTEGLHLLPNWTLSRSALHAAMLIAKVFRAVIPLPCSPLGLGSLQRLLRFSHPAEFDIRSFVLRPGF